MEYHEKLLDFYSRLNPTIAFVDLKTSNIRQDSKIVRLIDLYFDIKSSGFLRPKDLAQNIEVLYKLKTYAGSHLISWIKEDKRWKVLVYNKYGHLIYKQFVIIVSDYGFIRKYWLEKKYPELVLKEG